MMRLYLLMFVVILLNPGLSNSQMLKVISYNIRYDNPNDGESAWANRKNDMIAFLEKSDADIIGLQEVLKNQFDFMTGKLIRYQVVGVGREDGKTKGEYSPILFDKAKFRQVNFETVWLSEKPDVPGVGWDAALERIATFLVLERVEDGKRFLVVNAHYDHRGEIAREQSSSLLVNKIDGDYKMYPLILMGDINAEPDTKPVQIFAENYFDTFSCPERKGPAITFSGFTNLEYDKGPRIDYIFTKDFECINFEILTPRSGDRNLSDHLPVTSIIEFRIP